MSKVLRTKGFREEVGRVVFAVNKMEVEVAAGVPLPDAVIMHVDMLRTTVHGRVSGEKVRAEVITEEYWFAVRVLSADTHVVEKLS